MGFQSKAIWILQAYNFIMLGVNSQTLSSNLPHMHLCPGDIVTFNCETRGSTILAWTSDEYIETGGTRLAFGTFNSVGTEEISPLNPNTVATLISNTIEDGVPVLVSTLRIRALSQFLNSSVTCIHIGSGTTNTTMVQVLGDPIKPQIRDIGLRNHTNGLNCIVHLSWTYPSNFPVDDIKHYIVQLYGIEVATEIDDDNNGFVSTVYAVCSCNDSYEFSVSAVNRCGRIGPSETNSTQDSHKTLHTLSCNGGRTTEPLGITVAGSFSDPKFIAVAVVLVVYNIPITAAVILFIVICIIRHKKISRQSTNIIVQMATSKELNEASMNIEIAKIPKKLSN